MINSSKLSLPVLTIIFCYCLSQSIQAAPALPQEKPVPGGIALVQIPPAVQHIQWQFRGKPVWILKNGKQKLAVIGIPLNQPVGVAELRTPDGQSLSFQVQPHSYEESRIYLTDQNYVTPDQATLARIKLESKEIRQQFTVFTKDRTALRFAPPVQGPWSSRFGLRRFFNDQPRKPHSGLDIAAAEGSIVSAPSNGKVLNTGDYYFNGKTVFLDHGHGLVTMYCHLDSITVKPGQRVRKGKPLGTVGQTGRVTGAHLHWSVNLGGTMVDPTLFLAQDQ